MSTDLSEWIEIGRVVAPQGLNGEVRVYPDSDFPERFVEPGDRWLLRPGSKTLESIRLESGRFLEGKGLYVLRLAGITERSQAELLRGAKLMVAASDRPPLAEGEFHILDLVGLTVQNGYTQEIIGTVIGLASAGNDLLEIELHNAPGKTILVPLVKAFVKSLDLPGKRLELLPIPGLITDI
ncbi:MAG: ribosome maturation factor RimM [Thermosynechococcaceae cyanobacterium]